MRRLSIALLALLPAVALAQRPDQLTRTTSTTGANDSLIIAGCDSVRPTCRMRGLTIGQSRKSLSVAGFDSLIVAANSHLRYSSGDTVVGQPVYASAQLLPGSITNDTALTGNVGQFAGHSTVAASQIRLSSATPVNVDSLSLTAGDWDVTGTIAFADSVVKRTIYQGGTDTVSATFQVPSRSIQIGSGGHANGVDSASSGTNIYTVPTIRYSLASTTKVYLICSSTFTINVTKCYGTIRARRVR